MGTSQEFWGIREHDHLYQGNKGYFWVQFEGTRDIVTIKRNSDEKFRQQ